MTTLTELSLTYEGRIILTALLIGIMCIAWGVTELAFDVWRRLHARHEVKTFHEIFHKE